MIRISAIRLLTGFAIAIPLNFAHAQAQTANPIKIGVIYPISGAGAIYGVPSMMGNDLAIDEINAKGGILGRKVVAIVRDDKFDPAVGAAAAKELITNEKVDVLIGGMSSAVGLAISEVALEEKIVYIASIPQSIQLTTTKLHKYIFRTSSNTDFEGDAMAQEVKKVGIKKLCNLQLDYAYGRDLSDGLKKGLKRYAPNVPIVLELWPTLKTTDWSIFINQIMASGCDGVTSSVWGNWFIALAKQAKPYKMFDKVKFLVGSSVGSQEVTGQMKNDYPNNVYSNAWELWYHSNEPVHAAYQAALAKRSGKKDTDSWPVLGYIGIMTFAKAAEKAGSVQSDKLVAALEGLSFLTPVGKLTIDPKTHQADIGQFWGPIVKKPGLDYWVMDPATYIRYTPE